MSAGETDADKALPFLEHLEELRRVLIFCIAAVVIVAIAAWFISDKAIWILGHSVGHQLNFAGVTEAFYTRVKISVVLGFLGALPLVMYRLWRFIAPGLFHRERSAIFPLVLISTVLFYLGVGFAYFIVVPTATRFLLAFGAGVVEPVIMIGDYFGFVSRFCIVFGAVFQLPLIISSLSYMGLVSSATLLRKWRYALVGVVIFAAILTPPDIVSQLMMAGPLMALYFVSVWLASGIERRKRRVAERAAEEDSGHNPEM
ncbi:MAG: twin-arginine translocase subunit TatC [Candidatus Eisenbacteria sp.]|nr:twin-arginine translocase subunit TatC [Candidatus Eisenbacteria bacterium]